MRYVKQRLIDCCMNPENVISTGERAIKRQNHQLGCEKKIAGYGIFIAAGLSILGYMDAKGTNIHKKKGKVRMQIILNLFTWGEVGIIL